MARLMGEKLMEHQHKLCFTVTAYTYHNASAAAWLRARPATEGDDTYWAELRRDKRIYFFATGRSGLHAAV